MEPIELALVRGRALEFLRAWLDRERPISATSEPTYMIDDLLQEILAHNGHPMTRTFLNGSVMTYLRDAGLAEYRTSQPAGPKGPTLMSWRITHDGMAVLEGRKGDSGVRVV